MKYLGDRLVEKLSSDDELAAALRSTGGVMYPPRVALARDVVIGGTTGGLLGYSLAGLAGGSGRAGALMGALGGAVGQALNHRKNVQLLEQYLAERSATP